tara:strand:+ start:1989 stop:3161 length:1173 start_codon:yes stop_codon:yes gene_type:complete
MTKNITVVGLGYVGLSLSILISQKNKVVGLDIDKKKVNNINERISPIIDKEMSIFLSQKNLLLEATTDSNYAFSNADFIIIAVPTNYSAKSREFDTEIVETIIIKILKVNIKATIVIKSTVPIGFTEKIRRETNYENIFFSPEFLREGKSLYDNLYPSRIIVGGHTSEAKEFATLLKGISIKKNVPLIFMKSKEAEAVKLFSNTYLAMRVAFFNELDTFSEINELDSLNIINGISLDERIGNFYNNPSFGYGGYCLPKDTRQLLSNYKDIPNKIIKSVIESNDIRKEFIVKSIIKKNPTTVGIYRLTMKENSDNFKESAILDIIDILIKKNINIIIFEPYLDQKTYNNLRCYSNLEKFINDSDIIVANRLNDDLKNVNHKVYSRDIFRKN